jgi:hypothetical protein
MPAVVCLWLAACTVAGNLISCRWARIYGLRTNAKTVTVVTRALVAGVHVNPAQVTTTTQETNPDNNFDTSTANVKVKCTAYKTANCAGDTLFGAAQRTNAPGMQ